jgi:hypothetical protein
MQKEIITYLDKYGIPYHRLSVIGFTVTENDDDYFKKIIRENDESIERTLEAGGLLINLRKTEYKYEPLLNKVFKIGKEEQYQIIYEWFVNSTGFKIKSFESLFGVPSLNGKPFLLETDGSYYGSYKHICLAKRYIHGDLSIQPKTYRGNYLASLGNIEVIRGNFSVHSPMKDLGKLEIVYGDMYFGQRDLYQTDLKSLKPLRIIKGDLNLKNLDASCETLEEVGGNLNIRKSRAYSFKNLKKVKGNILISKASINEVDFSSVEIGGTIKSYNDNI